MKTTPEKLERTYAKKLSNRMNAIDRKYEKRLANIEKDKEAEKQKQTRILMEKLRKDQIALKTWTRTLTPHEKARAEKTSYADACWLVQLLAKLRDTNNEWFWRSITSPGDLLPRDELDWWHCIAKSKSRAVSLDYRNVNAQSKRDNATRWGNGMYEVYKVRVDEKRGAGTHDDLLRLKDSRQKVNAVQRIKENIETVEMMLESKTFDTSSYWKEIKRMKKKYCSDI